tara:strand:+ start:818 stop:1000 length:183 start_codon:yes stop_codon:yes gene_type:complete
MTHHYIDPTSNQLDIIIERLSKNNIYYEMVCNAGKVIKLSTDDTELIAYSLNNNPNLVLS